MIYRAWDLPKKVEFGGRSWDIRTDFRDILTIISAFDDPDLKEGEKLYTALKIFYKDFDDIPESLYGEAYDQFSIFCDHGVDKKDTGKRNPRMMDWQQDASILFPAVNKVAGKEVREMDYMHWWTFMGYFLEIRGGVYGTVMQLRQKKAKHKKLEKEEQEFWRSNRDICEIKPRLSAEEEAEKARLKAILDG